MRRSISLVVLAVVLTLGFCGCKMVKIEEEEPEDISYTVIQQEEVPDEIEVLIEERKMEEFQLTYKSGDEFYLFKGYGQQMTGGYSIQVVELSESENAIFFETKLIGPSEENRGGAPSYPYIGVKLEYRDKPVQFR